MAARNGSSTQSKYCESLQSNHPSHHLLYISWLLPLLKVTDVPVQASDISYLTVSLTFQIFLLVVPEMSTSFASYIVYIIYTAFVLDPAPTAF
jgi:hypothetical protein